MLNFNRTLGFGNDSSVNSPMTVICSFVFFFKWSLYIFFPGRGVQTTSCVDNGRGIVYFSLNVSPVVNSRLKQWLCVCGSQIWAIFPVNPPEMTTSTVIPRLLPASATDSVCLPECICTAQNTESFLTQTDCVQDNNTYTLLRRCKYTVAVCVYVCFSIEDASCVQGGGWPQSSTNFACDLKPPGKRRISKKYSVLQNTALMNLCALGTSHCVNMLHLQIFVNVFKLFLRLHT